MFLQAFKFYVYEKFGIITICTIIIAIPYSICEVWSMRVHGCVMVLIPGHWEFCYFVQNQSGTSQLSFQFTDSSFARDNLTGI